MVEAESSAYSCTFVASCATRIFARLEQEEREVGYIDFITISAGLMFSMKYKMSIPEMKKEALYNNMRKSDYPTSEDYLQGITVVSCDYKEVFARYKHSAPQI